MMTQNNYINGEDTEKKVLPGNCHYSRLSLLKKMYLNENEAAPSPLAVRDRRFHLA